MITERWKGNGWAFYSICRHRWRIVGKRGILGLVKMDTPARNPVARSSPSLSITKKFRPVITLRLSGSVRTEWAWTKKDFEGSSGSISNWTFRPFRHVCAVTDSEVQYQKHGYVFLFPDRPSWQWPYLIKSSSRLPESHTMELSDAETMVKPRDPPCRSPSLAVTKTFLPVAQRSCLLQAGSLVNDAFLLPYQCQWDRQCQRKMRSKLFSSTDLLWDWRCFPGKWGRLHCSYWSQRIQDLDPRRARDREIQPMG